jgi:hypothetical protein
MTKVKKLGKLPVNSRVLIDYTGKKPEIRFGYPRKDAVHQNSISTPAAIIALILWLIIFLCLYIFIDENLITQYTPSDCSVNQSFNNFTLYNGSEYFYISNITIDCDNFSQTLSWNYGEKLIIFGKDYTKEYYLMRGEEGPGFTQKQDYTFKYLIIIFSLFIISLIFLIMLYYKLVKLVGWLLSKTSIGIKAVPYLNKATVLKGYYICYENVKTSTIEIPLFSNTYLNYNSTDDYSKYLKKVVILEHPFQEIVKQGKKKKKLKNVRYWLCQFQFSRVPKKGKLEVWFY